MKLMTKCFISLLLFSVTATFASEPVQNSYGYLGIGVGPLPFPIPNFQGGFRQQQGHHGWDFSAQVATIGCATDIKGNALYLYYFKPNLSSQFYAGGGMALSYLWAHGFRGKPGSMFMAPEFVFGKEYLNESNDRRFVQVQIDWPAANLSHFPRHSTFMPLVVFSYGIGF
jgi:hypothetical protein